MEAKGGTRGAVELNLDHPACQLAMRRQDAWTLALVTAAVYGAINRFDTKFS
jgi:hypothetical protein